MNKQEGNEWVPNVCQRRQLVNRVTALSARHRFAQLSEQMGAGTVYHPRARACKQVRRALGAPLTLKDFSHLMGDIGTPLQKCM